MKDTQDKYYKDNYICEQYISLDISKSKKGSQLTHYLIKYEIYKTFMAKFSTQEIESQYNLIKMLLSNSRKYSKALEVIRKDIKYMPKELRKKLEEENIIL